MGVFQVAISGATIVQGVPKIKHVSGLFISSRPDGLAEDQLETLKRDIVTALNAPAYEVTFEITCEELSREQLLGFARQARTNEQIRAPKTRPRVASRTH